MIADDIAERIATALEQLAAEARTANLLTAGTTATVPDAEQVASRDKALARLGVEPTAAVAEPRRPEK